MHPDVGGVSPTLASIIVSTIPLFTPIFAWLLIRERVNNYEIIGLIISFAGVSVLVIENLQIDGRPFGILLMSIAVLGGTFYGIILKKLTGSYSALTITKYQTYIGMLLFMPFFYIFEYHQFLTINLSFDVYKYVLLLGILPSSLSFTLLAMAVHRLGIVRANIFSYLIPVFAALMAFYMAIEPFSTVKIIGMAIVILGLCLSQVNKLRIFNK